MARSPLESEHLTSEAGETSGLALDLWSSRFAAPIPWRTVDDFLGLREREGPRIEYRSGVDATSKEKVPRIVETIGAMANSGGGLIFVGVKQGPDDRPDRWPTLEAGDLTIQRIESLCRSALDPYVQVDVGRADDPEGRGSVWVVRIPADFDGKPVFVEGKGVLARLGEASVPAPVPLLREWLVEDEHRRDLVGGRLTRALPTAPNLEDPVFVMAATPTRPSRTTDWGDDVDDSIQRLVSFHFADLKEMTTAEEIVDFKVENARGDLLRHVWVDNTATVFRRFLLLGTGEGTVDALRVAGEIRRTWLFAGNAIRAIMPGYDGDVAYRVAIGSVKSGFESHREMAHKLQHASRGPVWSRSEWMLDGITDIDTAWEEVTEGALTRMLRAFGYRRVASEVAELVSLAPASASAMDPPW